MRARLVLAFGYLNGDGWYTGQYQKKKKSYLVHSSKSKRKLVKNGFPNIQTPEYFQKMVVHTLSHNFRNATRLEHVRLQLPIEPHSTLVKIIYAGVNASDVNFSSGRYFSSNAKEAAAHLPFDAGFEVLKKEFPRGVDIIYESVGGETFDVCLNALAVYGRLIVIGMISQYQGEEGWKPQNYTGLCEKILGKSQTVAGFFLIQYAHLWQDHLEKLFNLYASGKLKVFLDPKKFLGVASMADAVEYLHSGRSVGKVVVCMDPSYGQTLAKL